MKRAFACFAVFVLSALGVFGQEVLTNRDVIALSQAGLSNEVILEKIRSTPCRFDTSTAGLLALKESRIPDALIQEMLRSRCEAGAAATLAPRAQADAPGSPTPAAPDATEGKQPTPTQLDLVVHSTGGEPRVLLEYSAPRTDRSDVVVQYSFWEADCAKRTLDAKSMILRYWCDVSAVPAAQGAIDFTTNCTAPVPPAFGPGPEPAGWTSSQRGLRSGRLLADSGGQSRGSMDYLQFLSNIVPFATSLLQYPEVPVGEGGTWELRGKAQDRAADSGTRVSVKSLGKRGATLELTSIVNARYTANGKNAAATTQAKGTLVLSKERNVPTSLNMRVVQEVTLTPGASDTTGTGGAAPAKACFVFDIATEASKPR